MGDDGVAPADRVTWRCPELRPTSSRARAFAEQALHSPTFVVTSIVHAGHQRIGYAVANSHDPTYVVYAERSIPANRRVPVENDSAFSNLNFATYLGPTSRAADLATTDLPVSALPLPSSAARDVIPFGDTTLTLVATPRQPLGGTLGGELPWIFIVGGGLITIATAFGVEQLVRRKRVAEQDAATIAGLYEQVDNLYGEQRTIAETLQRSLLPQQDPTIPNLDIACRYVAGAAGVDIGATGTASSRSMTLASGLPSAMCRAKA